MQLLNIDGAMQMVKPIISLSVQEKLLWKGIRLIVNSGTIVINILRFLCEREVHESTNLGLAVTRG